MMEPNTNPEPAPTTEDRDPLPKGWPTNQNVDEQQKLRRAYCEQLRRVACPGCGEGEPQF